MQGHVQFLVVFLCTLSSFAPAIWAASSGTHAFSVPVRASWKGYDGFWSPVSIRIGTPPQWVDVFVSTASQETWAVGTSGCDGTDKCVAARGGVFSSNMSSSWRYQDTYKLGLDPQLGFAGKGIYGWDSIALDDRTSVPSQLVGVINTTEYWLGFLGLGVTPTNLTALDEKTFLSSMVENQSVIPSHSYGYTAGAYYRLKSVPASLTLGGYDANRFTPHNLSFELAPNQAPVVAINSISATAAPLPSSNVTTGWNADSIELLQTSQANVFTIDSSTPYLWLPEAVCLQFEKALGLTYDNDLELYTFGQNQSQHQRLIDWNVTFQFTLADLPGSSKAISLDLPYAAFDLQLSYPYPRLNITEKDPPIPYFPLRKAANSTQYTIGRTFLQEAYLVVDYERNNFSLYPANFALDPLRNMQLIDISRPKNSTFGGPREVQSSLSKGSIAGIIVAAIFGFCLIIGMGVLLLRLRRSSSAQTYKKEWADSTRSSPESKPRLVERLLRLSEKSSHSNRSSIRQVPELQGYEEVSSASSDIGSSNRTIRGFYEKDLRERDEEEEKAPVAAVNAIGHDPSMPVELPYRSSSYHKSHKGGQIPEMSPKSSVSTRPEVPALVKDGWRPLRRVTVRSAAVSSPSEIHNSPALDPFQVISPISPESYERQDDVSSLETIARRAAWYVSAESPSVSSESQSGTMRSYYNPINIEERASFPARHSTHNTVSSLDRSTTPGTPSANHTLSTRGTPMSYSKVPRNSVATRLGRAESTATSDHRSASSTVTNEIRRSVQRGFSWIQTSSEETQQHSTQPTTATGTVEQSPYSPARWIEFWRTGRDPRLGPMSNNSTPRLGNDR